MKANPRFTAILLFSLGLLFCSLADIVVKWVGYNIPLPQLIFLRFTIALLFLMPIALKKRVHRSKILPFHLLRALLLITATFSWFAGVKMVPITQATVIGFSLPLFIQLFSPLFLKEKVSKKRFFITLFGFIGVIIATRPTDISQEPLVLSLVIATIFYALLDTLNKFCADKEEPFNMLFYSSLFGFLFTLPLGIIYWTPIPITGWLFSGTLALFSLLILLCTFHAYILEEVSFLAPLHYIELLFSTFFSWVIFSEIPSLSTYAGSVLILLSIIFLTRPKKQTALRKI
ncbi:DMT family transporter [Candidatus Neptunochlamydia vexilliferae]|uniref:S-adenosylmethionine uptake transporter n=1 Tax=Candidatus Neptunichlamydia vexilliferae TaxID=1651774 RepID=A0ABS0AXY7_9BACT|nr:DMT family transporter [Candidatus Neptunochlamydia vexilliferae]MBF5058999.1 S-adenosylmethionine uptake transporter [Candidatus Neptunochlamydia vexilliferae]